MWCCKKNYRWTSIASSINLCFFFESLMSISSGHVRWRSWATVPGIGRTKGGVRTGYHTGPSCTPAIVWGMVLLYGKKWIHPRHLPATSCQCAGGGARVEWGRRLQPSNDIASGVLALELKSPQPFMWNECTKNLKELSEMTRKYHTDTILQAPKKW